MANQKQLELLQALEAAAQRKRFFKLEFFLAYPKQQQFFDLGLTKRERLLMAGNQQGKSEGGAYEAALHLTGRYPADWMGRRFDHPVRAWAAGEAALDVRDIAQTKLCGTPGVEDDFGTGFIPREDFADKPSLSRGVTDAYDTIQVTHHRPNLLGGWIVDGISTLSFKSYEQGRAKFQGRTLDFIWLDEEPPEDIYNECLARITATRGMLYVTFTPLKGMSSVVVKYLQEDSPDRGVVTMVIEDALHIPPEERARIIAGYAPHERDARVRGVPMLGSGRIFQYAEDAIAEPPLEYLPAYWTKLWGVDFGIDHPFAAVLIAWDRDNDVVHVLQAIRMKDALPIMHAAAMKPIGANIPVSWPQDGTQRQTDGEPLAAHYKRAGLKMRPQHATWPEGGISTEAGILEMQERMATGRLKVAAHLSQWWEEFRLYHRKDGQIVKLQDDLMSATRIAIMDKRFSQALPLGGPSFGNRRQQVADGVDFDVFDA